MSKDERLGFVFGLVDCYTFEVKGRATFDNRNPVVAEELITAFYDSAQEGRDRTVWNVLLGLRDRRGEPLRGTRGAEVAKGPHGIFDGEFWRANGAVEGRPFQAGFVEGYLWCHSTLVGSRGATFSRPASAYVAAINTWYRFDAESATIDSRRGREPIAWVLFRFRDRHQ